MNILYLGSFRLPNYDAAAPRVLNIARSMVMNGHSVNFVSWGGNYRESDKCVDGKYRIDGMKYIVTGELDAKGSLFTRFKAKLNRGKITLEILNNLKTLPDVIIMYQAGSGLTKKLLKFCSIHNIYLVNDITEWYSNNEIRFTDIIPNWLNMTKLQHKVQNKIVISTFLDKYYKDTHNIVIPATCDFQEEKWSREQFENDFNGITFIYAGSPARKDKLHIAINVIQKLVDEGEKVRFIILGITRNDYLNKYHNLIIKPEISNQIEFLGRVSQDAVPSYYKSSDFMILLRDNNRKSTAGFPTKFAESMVSGTPVVANLTSDLGKYLKSGFNGFVVESPTYQGLYNTIHDKVLSLNSETIHQMKSNAKKIGLQSFDYRNYHDKIQRFLLNLRGNDKN